MKIGQSWKKTMLFITLFMALALMFPTKASAQGIIAGDTVNEGEVLDHNAFLNGTSVVMDGVINGDLLAVGNNIKINGEVNGDLVVMGGNVVLNGPVSGSAYIGAGLLVLGPQASVGRDVYFLGGRGTTEAGSKIDRDLNIVGLESNLAGEVNRKVNSLVGPVVLAQKIYEFMISQGWLPQTWQKAPGTPQARQIDLAVHPVAFGLTTFQPLIPASLTSDNRITTNSLNRVQSLQPANAIDTERLKSWAVPMLRTLVGLLLIGLLLVWLVPAQLHVASEHVHLQPWRSLLYGLLVFVIGWLAAVLILVLVLALAFFFYWASLPNLGFLTGSLGLISLGLALTIFWLSIAYFSKIIVAYLVVVLVFKRWIPSLAQNRILPLVIGVILYALLASIPYLGVLISAVATLIGLGGLWMFLTKNRLPEIEEVTQAEPEDINPEVVPAEEG
ncbi:MAG: hypothetical protein C3F13_19580 [Anaerolineales bacterium]|nr:hypothetical protein [Anaerolineae bacterium]PWB49597.1 MAG: hypothetical protein C3F13_19580 [Anaerolineales bacterium]